MIRKLIILISFSSIFVTSSCKKDVFSIEESFINPEVGFECERTNLPEDTILNLSGIEGYTDKMSYYPGEIIYFSIHSITAFHTISIIRYGVEQEIILKETRIEGKKHDYDPYSYSWGCAWDTSFTFVVPISATSGLYSAQLINEHGQISYITFIIKPSKGSKPEIVLLASTNTWQAYNRWSGASFYYFDRDDDIPRSQIVSFHRPNISDVPYGNSGHLTNGEGHLIRWLEKEGIEYGLYSDRDFHDFPRDIKTAEILLINTHSEYWTEQMMDNIEKFIELEGDVMYLSGNGLYWKVAYACDRIEVRKTGENHVYGEGIGGKWSEIGRPESAIVGVAYDRRGFQTYAPYEVLKSNHWVFDGTSIKDGDLIGEEGLNGGGASGWETDKMTEHTPSFAIHLAKGTNPDGGGADMVLLDYPNEGKVFSVGSITYCGSLEVDTNIAHITRNVINKFLEE